MKIVCLIACHVSAPEHLVYFDEMLNSVTGQTSTTHRVLISISKSPDQIYPNIPKNLLKNVEIYLEETKISQFEHYSKLMSYLEYENPHTTWVCFGDADDLWHPRRIESYQQVITRISDNIITIMTGHHLRGANLKSGVYEANGPRTFTEHWNLCVRLFFVRYFLQSCPPTIKSHNFCDVLFSQWIRGMHSPLGEDRGTALFNPSDENNWMYFYRKHKLSITSAEKSFEDSLVNNVDNALASFPTNTQRAKDIYKEESAISGNQKIYKLSVEKWEILSEESVFNSNKLTDLFPNKNGLLGEYFTEKSTDACSHCKMLNPEKKCGKCGVRYCNREHQVLDWHKHKTLCNSILILEPYWQYEELYVKVIRKLNKIGQL